MPVSVTEKIRQHSPGLVDRTRKCADAVLATVLAVYLAHYLGLREIWWSAICAFSLTGLGLRASASQGVQQISGTICGTVLGLLLSRYVGDQIGIFVISITCLSAAGLYLATSRAAGYLWILCTALAIYMIAAAHAQTDVDPVVVVKAMCADAITGTAAYWVVTALSESRLLAPRGPRGPASTSPATPTLSPAAASGRTFGGLRHTVAGAITLSILAWLAWRHPIDGFEQAMTTAPVILVVPLDARGGWYRIIALCVFLWLACHPRFGDANISYAGTQLGAVVILAFVHDGGWLSDDVSVAYHRLLGVASGIAALALVLAVVGGLFSSSRFSPASREQADGASSSR